MSKFLQKNSKLANEFNRIVVQVLKVDLEQINQYIKNTRNNAEPPSVVSLNDYLSSLPENKGKLIIADLSGLSFDNDLNKARIVENQNRAALDPKIVAQTKDILMDLRGVNFSGAILTNTMFSEVDLTSAIFRDANLAEVSFKQSNLNSLDLRGTDLSATKFDEDYGELIKAGKGKYVENVKLSSTADLIRDYAGIKPTLKDQTASSLEQDKIVNKSLRYIFSSDSTIFDPTYIRGSGAKDSDHLKQYIRLTDEEVKTYLTIIKDEANKNLAINDFASNIAAQQRKIKIAPNMKIIADFSGRANHLNQWQTKDALFETNAGVRRAKFDFRGVNLSGANFAGANLEGYDFTNAKLNGASFESANLSGAIFNNTQAKDTNFYNANLAKVNIVNNSVFRRAFMAKSKAVDVLVKDADFTFVDISSGRWPKATLEQVKIDYANISGLDMSNCTVIGVALKRAKADNIKMNDKSKFREVDASGSSMRNAEIKDGDITKCNFDDVDAGGANFTKTTIDELKAKNWRIEGGNFQQITFIKGDLNGTNAKGTNFAGAIINETAGRILADVTTEMDASTVINAPRLSFNEIDGKGKKVTLSAEKKKEQQVQANIAKENAGASHKVGGILKSAGKSIKGKAEFVKKPFGMTTGIAVGILAGGVVATAIAVAVIASGGSILIPLAGVGLIAGVAAGGIAVGAVAGGIVGGVIAKRGGVCGLAAVGLGTMVGGPIGGLIAGIIYHKANRVTEKIIGTDIDSAISTPMNLAGAIIEGVGVGLDSATPEGKATEKQRAALYKKRQENSIKDEKSTINAESINRIKLQKLAEVDRKADVKAAKQIIEVATAQKNIERNTAKKVMQNIDKSQSKNQQKSFVSRVVGKIGRATGYTKNM